MNKLDKQYLYQYWTNEDAPMVSYDENGKPIKWHITLNEYQRANLLWLLCDLVGHGKAGIFPFTFANTGDWAGEIPIMLNASYKTQQKPNVSAEEVEERVKIYLNLK